MNDQKIKKNSFFCDFKTSGKGTRKGKKRFYRHKGNFSWHGIHREKYKSACNSWTDIIRQTLIGNHGESAKFHLRYFEIAPNGYSSFEKHRHEHVVIGIRGEGVCTAGNRKYKIRFLDTLYINPDEPHQLRNPFNEPFGFFCIVNAKRDKPIIIAP